MSKIKIKALDGFSNVSDGDVLARGIAVQNQMTANPHFPNPSVDLATFKTDLDAFSLLIAEALDGGKKIVAEKNMQREHVVNQLRLLGRYVEITSKDDLPTFQTSGFNAASTTRVKTPPLSEKIRKVAHGPNSGQIEVWVQALPDASSYELRGGPSVGGVPPSTWTTAIVTNVKGPVVFSALTPGTVYAFQARALVKDGYTDWSDSVTFMCT